MLLHFIIFFSLFVFYKFFFSFFLAFFKFFFSFFFQDPSTIFFYSLIITHNFILCLLFFVIILVTWLLFIILRDYTWGKFVFIKYGFFRPWYLLKKKMEYLKLYSFFYFFYFFYFFIYNFFYFFRKNIESFDFFNDSFIYNYYFQNNNTFDWNLYFFVLGEYCLRDGTYCNTFNERLNFWSEKDYVATLRSNKLQQNFEIFLYGNSVTEGYVKQDSVERPYVIQQFLHHYKLELFWAFFPTIKCLTILIPSLILLYSSASLKFYDNLLHVTANQWYWNFSSKVSVKTDYVPTFFYDHDIIYPPLKMLTDISDNWTIQDLKMINKFKNYLNFSTRGNLLLDNDTPSPFQALEFLYKHYEKVLQKDPKLNKSFKYRFINNFLEPFINDLAIKDKLAPEEINQKIATIRVLFHSILGDDTFTLLDLKIKQALSVLCETKDPFYNDLIMAFFRAKPELLLLDEYLIFNEKHNNKDISNFRLAEISNKRIKFEKQLKEMADICRKIPTKHEISEAEMVKIVDDWGKLCDIILKNDFEYINNMRNSAKIDKTLNARLESASTWAEAVRIGIFETPDENDKVRQITFSPNLDLNKLREWHLFNKKSTSKDITTPMASNQYFSEKINYLKRWNHLRDLVLNEKDYGLRYFLGNNSEYSINISQLYNKGNTYFYDSHLIWPGLQNSQPYDQFDYFYRNWFMEHVANLPHSFDLNKQTNFVFIKWKYFSIFWDKKMSDLDYVIFRIVDHDLFPHMGFFADTKPLKSATEQVIAERTTEIINVITAKIDKGVAYEQIAADILTQIRELQVLTQTLKEEKLKEFLEDKVNVDGNYIPVDPYLVTKISNILLDFLIKDVTDSRVNVNISDLDIAKLIYAKLALVIDLKNVSEDTIAKIISKDIGDYIRSKSNEAHIKDFLKEKNDFSIMIDLLAKNMAKDIVYVTEQNKINNKDVSKKNIDIFLKKEEEAAINKFIGHNLQKVVNDFSLSTRGQKPTHKDLVEAVIKNLPYIFDIDKTEDTKLNPKIDSAKEKKRKGLLRSIHPRVTYDDCGKVYIKFPELPHFDDDVVEDILEKKTIEDIIRDITDMLKEKVVEKKNIEDILDKKNIEDILEKKNIEDIVDKKNFNNITSHIIDKFKGEALDVNNISEVDIANLIFYRSIVKIMDKVKFFIDDQIKEVNLNIDTASNVAIEMVRHIQKLLQDYNETHKITLTNETSDQIRKLYVINQFLVNISPLLSDFLIKDLAKFIVNDIIIDKSADNTIIKIIDNISDKDKIKVNEELINKLTKSIFKFIDKDNALIIKNSTIFNQITDILIKSIIKDVINIDFANPSSDNLITKTINTAIFKIIDKDHFSEEDLAQIINNNIANFLSIQDIDKASNVHLVKLMANDLAKVIEQANDTVNNLLIDKIIAEYTLGDKLDVTRRKTNIVNDHQFDLTYYKLLLATNTNDEMRPFIEAYATEIKQRLLSTDLDCRIITQKPLKNDSFLIKNVEFISSINNDSFMIADNEIILGQRRVLDTDCHLIISSLRSTRFLVNALDVLHSFAILSTGIKVDAIIGRINDMSVFFLREGLFFGQCSELCGSGHFGMPIVVEVLEPFNFYGYYEEKNWITKTTKVMVPYWADNNYFDETAEAEFDKYLANI